MRVLMFSTEHCVMCRQVKPMVRKVCAEKGVKLTELSAVEGNNIEKYNLRQVPTIIILDDAGDEIQRFSGYISEVKFRGILE